MKITDLSPANLTQILAKAGYNAAVQGDTTIAVIQANGKSYPAVITQHEGDLRITCQVTTLGEINQETIGLVAVSALSANMELAPFALALIKPESDAEVAATPLVLVDTLPTSDLSEEELLWSVEKLHGALIVAAQSISHAQEVASAA